MDETHGHYAHSWQFLNTRKLFNIYFFRFQKGLHCDRSYVDEIDLISVQQRNEESSFYVGSIVC